MNLIQILDLRLAVAGFGCNHSAQQERAGVCRVKGEDTVERLVSSIKGAARIKRFSGAVVNVPGLFLLAQLDVEVGKFRLGGSVFRVELQDFLEDFSCLAVVS